MVHVGVIGVAAGTDGSDEDEVVVGCTISWECAQFDAVCWDESLGKQLVSTELCSMSQGCFCVAEALDSDDDEVVGRGCKDSSDCQEIDGVCFHLTSEESFCVYSNDTRTTSSSPPEPVETTTSTTRTSTTRTSATMTSTTLVPQLCVGGFPTQAGVNATDCVGKYSYETCTVRCGPGFDGEERLYRCGDGLIAPDSDPISCRRSPCVRGLPSGPYNTTDCEGKVAGEFCIVGCNESDGYKESVHLLKCNDSGSFEGSVDVCERKECRASTLPLARESNVSDCAGVQAGGSCLVECAEGYLGSATTVTCGNDGAFVGTGPSCRIMTCDVPAALKSAGILHSCEDVEHGQWCRSKCSKGYVGGLHDYKCVLGALTGLQQPPSCAPVACKRGFPSGLGVRSNCSVVRTGEACQAGCMEGYKIDGGSGNCTCKDSGRLEDCDITCVKKSCPALDWGNASLDTSSCNSKKHGQRCGVLCARGYAPFGAALQVLECNASGNGSYIDVATTAPASALECRALPCWAFRKRITRGMNISGCDGVATGETCAVTALPGYTAAGGGELRCMQDGLISGVLPTISPMECAITSGMNSSGVDSTCGAKTMAQDCWTFCQKTHRGNFTHLMCEHVPANGTVLFQAIPEDGWVGDAASLPLAQCAAADRRRLTAGGYCDENHKDIAPSKTAGVDGSSCLGKASGEVCLAVCAAGYQITGAPVMYTCADNKTYTGSGVPQCSPKKCTGGFPSGLGVSHGCSDIGTDANCTASCAQGFNGSSTTFTCQSNGDLAGTSPSCTAKTCAPLNLAAQFATSACSNVSTNGTCLVECAEGYEGAGASYTCQPSGSIEGTPPNCTAKACGSSGVPVDADLLKSGCGGLTTGQNCTVQCAAGYTGTAQPWTCTAQGAVAGTKPTCRAATCPPLENKTGIEHTCSAVAYGSSCEVGCAANFELAAGESSQQHQCPRAPSS